MADVQKSLDLLVGLEKIKVWSLIVTLFGDLDNTGSQSLSGKQINKLLGHIGIKPEATRVALHRLKNENWIETTKSGRETFYKMSEKAKRETASVYSDVYDASIKYPQGWRLLISPDNQEMEIDVKIAVLKNVWLTPIALKVQDTDIITAKLDSQKIPVWCAKKIITPSTLKIAKKLMAVAEKPIQNATRLEEIALRLLILHHWRKLALRNSVWCYIWFFKDSSLAECHKSVSVFLKNTPNTNLSNLAN